MAKESKQRQVEVEEIEVERISRTEDLSGFDLETLVLIAGKHRGVDNLLEVVEGLCMIFWGAGEHDNIEWQHFLMGLCPILETATNDAERNLKELDEIQRAIIERVRQASRKGDGDEKIQKARS